MSILTPLGRPALARLWYGQVATAVGQELYAVAVVWIATGLLGQAAGYLSALQTATMLAGSLFLGPLTERVGHPALMIGTHLLRALVLMLLVMLEATGHLGLPAFTAAVVVVALAAAAFEPALQATIPQLVPEPGLRHATNGLFDATRRMARVAAPAIVAAGNQLLAAGQFFAATAAAFVVSAIMVRRATAGLGPTGEGGVAGGGLLSAAGRGLALVRRDPLMLYGILGNGLGNVGWAIGPLLGMVLHLRETSSDPLTDYGLMMTAYGVGNLAANLVLSVRAPRRPLAWLVISRLLFGAGLVAMPFAPGLAALMAAALVAGLNGPFESLAMLHLMQSRHAPADVARVYRLQMAAIFAGLLAGSLAAPSLFGLVGPGPAVALAGAVMLAAAAAGALPSVRRG